MLRNKLQVQLWLQLLPSLETNRVQFLCRQKLTNELSTKWRDNSALVWKDKRLSKSQRCDCNLKKCQTKLRKNFDENFKFDKMFTRCTQWRCTRSSGPKTRQKLFDSSSTKCATQKGRQSADTHRQYLLCSTGFFRSFFGLWRNGFLTLKLCKLLLTSKRRRHDDEVQCEFQSLIFCHPSK